MALIVPFQTFDPPVNPDIGSYRGSVQRNADVFETHAGYDEVRTRGLYNKTGWELGWSGLNIDEYEDIVGFFELLGPGGGPFIWTNLIPVESPSGWKLNDATSFDDIGQPQRRYYIQFTWYDDVYGETRPSAEVEFLIAADKKIQIQVPRFPNQVHAARIYIGTLPGTATLQATLLNYRKWTELGSLYTDGAPPPTVNTLMPPKKYLVESFAKGIDDVTYSCAARIIEQGI